jgi:hypothetical protein
MPPARRRSVSKGMLDRMSGSRSKFSVCALFVFLAVGALSGCSLDNPPNSDSRAYPKSEPHISLENGLKGHGLQLPPNATAVHFGANVPRDEGFHLEFDVGCASISAFLRASAFKGPLKSGVVPSLVTAAGRQHGWNIDQYKSVQGIEEDVYGPAARNLLVASVGGQLCRVFIASIK